MTTKRRRLNRSQGPAITAGMVELFKRGCELQAAGFDDVEAKGPEAAEFRAIDKQLSWSLLHCVGGPSVFDPALDSEPYPWLTLSHGAYRDWPMMQAWRKALMEAPAHRQAIQGTKILNT